MKKSFLFALLTLASLTFVGCDMSTNNNERKKDEVPQPNSDIRNREIPDTRSE